MTITYHADVFQGSEEWLALRCGVLTASKMKDILTSTFKIADNKTSRDLVLEIAAQRITNYIEPEYITADMIRGQNDEAFFKEEYYYNYG
ncbi:MAG: YqaJ viral recombinase family protein, partial [Holosporales bacterium]